jgi:hypothetical protein
MEAWKDCYGKIAALLRAAVNCDGPGLYSSVPCLVSGYYPLHPTMTVLYLLITTTDADVFSVSFPVVQLVPYPCPPPTPLAVTIMLTHVKIPINIRLIRRTLAGGWGGGGGGYIASCCVLMKAC